MTAIPQSINFNEVSVGDAVYCWRLDKPLTVTEKVLDIKGRGCLKLDGKLLSECSDLYLSKEDYVTWCRCREMSITIWHSFEWGVIPENITEDQLKIILGWIENKT